MATTAADDIHSRLGVSSEDAPTPGGSSSSGGYSSRWSDTPIYWGSEQTTIRSGPDAYEPNPATVSRPQALDYANAIDYIDVIRQTDPAMYEKIRAAMMMGEEPYLSAKSTSRSAVRSAWTQVVQDSARLAGQGTYVSPLQLLGQKVDGTWRKSVIDFAKENPVGATSGGPSTSTASETSTNTNVDLTNRSEAQRILDQALSQYLGRKATPEEIRRFRNKLNSEEEENPNVTTSDVTRTVNSDGQGNTKSKSKSSNTSEGGVDPAQTAINFARRQEGAGEYQAATTYLDAFKAALQGDTLA